MNTIAVATIVGVAIAATGGYVLIEELAHPDCIGDPVAGLTPGAGGQHIRLTLHMPIEDEPVRTCMYAEDRSKLFDQSLNAYGSTAQYWDLYVAAPVDIWVIDRSVQESSDFEDLAPDATVDQCENKVTEFLYEDMEGRGGLIAIQCEGDGNYMPKREPARQRIQYAGALPFGDDETIGGGGAFALTASLGALLVLGIKFRTPLQWAFIGLFTRIVAPRVLDQNVRSQIHQLVHQEPGIRPAEIAQRLELGAGQTTHHLRVLVQAQSLSLVRQGFALHYFPRGTYPPIRMQQLAALRSDSVARLHNAVREHPGAPLTTLANLGGLSKPRASRLAKRLQHLGLARAERHGKNVRLYPLN